MEIEQARKFLNKTGHAGVIRILNAAHKEALYYVDEWTDNFGGVHGYCTDKFVVGVHNKHTHYKLSDLRKLVMWEK